MKIMVTEKQLNQIISRQTEMGEQEQGTETGTSGQGSSTSAGSKKWESGVSRGPANQIGVTKWSDIVGSTITRGKSNPLW
jgi:hypothetical protein